MHFDYIEGLDEHKIYSLYNDLIETGDDTHIVRCRCGNGALSPETGVTSCYESYCTYWCRSIGSYGGGPCCS